jgi:hypothetical protein
VRDFLDAEEVRGSNPLAPTRKVRGQGPFRACHKHPDDLSVAAEGRRSAAGLLLASISFRSVRTHADRAAVQEAAPVPLTSRARLTSFDDSVVRGPRVASLADRPPCHSHLRRLEVSDFMEVAAVGVHHEQGVA